VLPRCAGRAVGPGDHVRPAAGDPVAAAVAHGFTDAAADRELAAFYAARRWRPLWVRPSAAGPVLVPAADHLLAVLADARRDGLAPERYDLTGLTAAVRAARGGSPAALARADRLLSRALTLYVVDLHRPVSGAGLIVADPAAAPASLTARGVLEAAARAPSLDAYLRDARRMNPTYEALRDALAAYRAAWSGLPRIPVPAGADLHPGASGDRVRALRLRLGLAAWPAVYDPALAAAVRRFQTAHGLTPDGVADAATVAALNAGPEPYERVIRVNLERARALPASPRRYILVDAGSATLQTFDDGRPGAPMRVIVGKPEQPTPALAGAVRYAVFNPYWNVPEDLVRDRLAPRVLREGPQVLDKERFQILSDWSDTPRVLAPAEVDWAAVAAGSAPPPRVRQLPGPDNMMGQVKFMMPNELGVYLHDTPKKALFAKAPRTFSSGCVRLERAQTLSRWLVGAPPPPAGQGAPERRVDLPAPVPVYITYFTAAPGPHGVVFRPDVYRRDPALARALR
jgi:murein L,D-transpeptidase YcbB/YkuD